MATTQEIVAQYEEMFAKRFTEEDPEYMKVVNRGVISPPCVTDWVPSSGSGYRYYSRGGDSRSHDSGHHSRHGDRHGDKHGSYDRHGNRYGDRHDDHRQKGDDDKQRPATEYGSRGYYELFY